METQTATQTVWAVDPAHSEITFKVRHMMISNVTGHFGSFKVDAKTDNDGFTDAAINVSIDTSSVHTKTEDRDNHLRSAEFFDSEQYPEMTFTSTSFDGSKLVGDLTIKDVTKTVELDVEFNGIAQDPYGQTKAGFDISGEIDRHAFGLTWDAVTEAGNVVVGKSVKLIMHVQLVRQS